MGFVSEFKEFAVKGNVIDLAIGVVIGGAFGKIIGSLIEDVITPLLLSPTLKAAHLENISQLTVMGTVKYGNFLSTLINFIIIAVVLFMVIKGVNKMKKKEAALPVVEPEPSNQEKLLMEIRDSLKK